MSSLNIQVEFARITGRWTEDPGEAEAYLDWLYETESVLTLADPQTADEAEDAFEERDCFCNGGEFICSPDCYHP